MNSILAPRLPGCCRRRQCEDGAPSVADLCIVRITINHSAGTYDHARKGLSSSFRLEVIEDCFGPGSAGRSRRCEGEHGTTIAATISARQRGAVERPVWPEGGSAARSIPVTQAVEFRESAISLFSPGSLRVAAESTNTQCRSPFVHSHRESGVHATSWGCSRLPDRRKAVPALWYRRRC